MPLPCSSYSSAMRLHFSANAKHTKEQFFINGELLLCCLLTNVYSLTNSQLKTALTNPDQFASAFVHTSFGDLHLTKFSLK